MKLSWDFQGMLRWFRYRGLWSTILRNRAQKKKISLNRRFNSLFFYSSIELFYIHFWLFPKIFPHDDIGRAYLQITFRMVKENKIAVSAVCKRKAFRPLPSHVITLFNLYFILKHMYRNKQIINSSLSSILCLACKPLTSLPVPQETAEGLVIGWAGHIHYLIQAASTLVFHVSMWRGLAGGVSFRGIWYKLLPFSCLAEGLTLAVFTCFKDKDNSIENPGYNQVFLSLWHVLFLCAGEHFLSQAICSASQGLCVFRLEYWE